MSTIRRRIETARERRVARAEDRRGFREGVYRVTEEGSVRWFKVEIQFYPSTVWWVVEITSPVHGREILGTQEVLTEEFQSKLETWV